MNLAEVIDEKLRHDIRKILDLSLTQLDSIVSEVELTSNTGILSFQYESNIGTPPHYIEFYFDSLKNQDLLHSKLANIFDGVAYLGMKGIYVFHVKNIEMRKYPGDGSILATLGYTIYKNSYFQILPLDMLFLLISGIDRGSEDVILEMVDKSSEIYQNLIRIRYPHIYEKGIASRLSKGDYEYLRKIENGWNDSAYYFELEEPQDINTKSKFEDLNVIKHIEEYIEKISWETPTVNIAYIMLEESPIFDAMKKDKTLMNISDEIYSSYSAASTGEYEFQTSGIEVIDNNFFEEFLPGGEISREDLIEILDLFDPNLIYNDILYWIFILSLPIEKLTKDEIYEHLIPFTLRLKKLSEEKKDTYYQKFMEYNVLNLQ